MLEIISTAIILLWIGQGLYTAARIRNDGYSAMWWIGTGIAAVALLLPLFAIFN